MRAERLRQLRDGIEGSVFALASEPANVHASYLVGVMEAMGRAGMASGIQRAMIADELAGLEWQLPNAYDHARSTLERLSWAELARGRDVAQLCGAVNGLLRLHALVLDDARALLRAVEADPACFALDTIALGHVGAPEAVVWSVLLVAGHPVTPESAQAYGEWLCHQVAELSPKVTPSLAGRAVDASRRAVAG